MDQLVFKGANDHALTNSLLVAEKFGKIHKNVLRDVRNLNCSEKFHRLNFELMVEMKELPQGGATKIEYYIMTKNGFTFLVMGYNGKQAGEFKEQYIDAFDFMEHALKSYSDNRNKVIEQNIKRRYLLNKELSEVNNSINLLMKRHKDIKTELKIIDDQDFAQLKLFPIHSYIELKTTEQFSHKLKISS